MPPGSQLMKEEMPLHCSRFTDPSMSQQDLRTESYHTWPGHHKPGKAAHPSGSLDAHTTTSSTGTTLNIAEPRPGSTPSGELCFEAKQLCTTEADGSPSFVSHA